MKSYLIGCSALLMILQTAALSAGLDLHWLWEDRCKDCHGHSADFARRHLSSSNDRLQGRHHVWDLRLFLHNHYLAGQEVDAVYEMLLAQVNTPPRFREECGRCHGMASRFVREKMVLRDGILYGRFSGLPIDVLLQRHKGIESTDADFFAQVLTRIAREIYRP